MLGRGLGDLVEGLAGDVAREVGQGWLRDSAYHTETHL